MVEELGPGRVQVESFELGREMAFLDALVVDEVLVDVREVLVVLVGCKNRLTVETDAHVVVCVVEGHLVLDQEWEDSQRAVSRP